MTKKEIASKLSEILQEIRSGCLREGIHDRRDLLGKVTALLSFNSVLHANAMQAGDILSSTGFSSSMYDDMEGRIEYLLSQGIAELELGIPQGNQGSKIFFGHGRSPIWRELKDFVNDRLALPWDEFNRVPIAGISNAVRLSQMVNDSIFAFLILTGEDEQLDGSFYPRLNVVHEAGLFQGKLGFEKAIVLLEEGCEEFSNIHGLGQIRFPKGNIKNAFEDIRSVLEREGIISKG